MHLSLKTELYGIFVIFISFYSLPPPSPLCQSLPLQPRRCRSVNAKERSAISRSSNWSRKSRGRSKRQVFPITWPVHCLSIYQSICLSVYLSVYLSLSVCLRPKAKDLVITRVVVLGFFVWSMPYQLPPPCYPQFFKYFKSIYLSINPSSSIFSVNLSIDLFHSLNINI